MKTVYFLIGVVLFFQSCSKLSTNQVMTGYIENNSEYKGGAAPPDFLLADLAIYRVSANQIFYVRPALNYAPFTPIITSFVTDANGNYSLNLPDGDYAIICKEKYDFEQNPMIITPCIYLNEPDFLLTIVSTQSNYSNQYTDKRNDCTPFPVL